MMLAVDTPKRESVGRFVYLRSLFWMDERTIESFRHQLCVFLL